MCGILWATSFTKHGVFKVDLCCSVNQYLIYFCSWIISHCMDRLHFVCPLFCLWAFWLVSNFWLLWIELLWMFMYKNTSFQLFWVYTRSRTAGSYGNSVFFRRTTNYFPQQLKCFTLPPQCMKFPISLHLVNTFYFPFLKNVAFLVKWHLIVVLISIFP